MLKLTNSTQTGGLDQNHFRVVTSFIYTCCLGHTVCKKMVYELTERNQQLVIVDPADIVGYLFVWHYFPKFYFIGFFKVAITMKKATRISCAKRDSQYLKLFCTQSMAFSFIILQLNAIVSLHYTRKDTSIDGDIEANVPIEKRWESSRYWQKHWMSNYMLLSRIIISDYRRSNHWLIWSKKCFSVWCFISIEYYSTEIDVPAILFRKYAVIFLPWFSYNPRQQSILMGLRFYMICIIAKTNKFRYKGMIRLS